MKSNVKITEKELRDMIKKYIKVSDCSSIISYVICEQLLKTEKGVENFIKATQGLVVKLSDYDLRIGDIVKINHDLLPGRWNWDFNLMLKAGLVIDECLECKVIDFDRTKVNSIQVSYNYVEEGTKKLKPYSTFINPEYIQENEKDINIDDAFKH